MTRTTTRRSSARRENLLRAASEVFREQGYVATSIDAIIERAGGSKRNIYREFGSKQGLFTAIVDENADRALAALAVEDIDERDLRTTLSTFGRHLLSVYMSPEVVGIYRIVITEAHRFPELVKAFYDKGPARTAFRLANILEGAARRGEIRAKDCPRLAEHFLGMIRDNLHLQVVLGLRQPPSPEETADMVDSAVEVFLSGIAARSQG